MMGVEVSRCQLGALDCLATACVRTSAYAERNMHSTGRLICARRPKASFCCNHELEPRDLLLEYSIGCI